MVIAAVVGVLASCASGPDAASRASSPSAASPSLPAPGDAAAPPSQDPNAGNDLVVARVDGQAIHAADVYRLLFLSAPKETADAVRTLVLDRIASGEARAIGASVPKDAVEQELARQLADQERKVREASKGRGDLAEFVKATYAMDLPEYTALIRTSFERSLLLERVALYELSRHPRTQVRVIRVKDRSLANDLRSKLALGADFAVLARQNSEDGSARDGGVYPPLPSDLPSPLFEQTESLREGEFSEVEEVSTPEGPRYRIMQVLARLPAETGTWAERSAAIEQQLAGKPLSPLEFEAWVRIMEERHQVRLLGRGTDDDRS
jgi:hypothetical protein